MDHRRHLCYDFRATFKNESNLELPWLQLILMKKKLILSLFGKVQSDFCRCSAKLL